MKSLCLLLALVTPPGVTHSFSGRWDVTITTPQGAYPSWLEIEQKNGTAGVHIVGRVSSVHPATDVKLEGAHLSFTSSEWFGKPTKVTWDLKLARGKLAGTQKREDGVEGQLLGVRAPVLLHKAPLAWTTPEPLFNGKDLTGWEPDNPSENHWTVQNNELVNEKPGANIRCNRKLSDFKLHIEYNCPQEGNSGIYLRGRYEVQVEYAKNDKFHGMGSVYGFLAPAVDISPRPGQWESFDITLVGRKVTIVRNGVTTINDQEIPGITGGALDCHEAVAGMIYIQGDHTGGMKYRNIRISVPSA